MKSYCRHLSMILIFTFAALSAKAQNTSQFTQYMYNTMIYNPGYTGSRGLLSIKALYRTQWLGFDGAPNTGTLAFNMPIGAYKRQGIGASLLQESIGAANETHFDASYSYTIDTSPTGKLAFGVKAGAHYLNVDFNKVNVLDSSDPLLQDNIKNFSPALGVGVYYYLPNFYLGLSAPDLLQTDYYVRNPDSDSHVIKSKITYYLISGYVFTLSDNILLKPAILLKAVSGSPLGVDMSVNAMFNEKFILGAAYRPDASISGLAGFQISDALMIGYSYDADTSSLGNYNSGSHEIFLRFDLTTKQGRRLSPRFF